MKIPVAILGATGSVGQKFVLLLANHPWFEIKALAASEKSQGKTYKEAVHWIQQEPIPENVAHMIVEQAAPPLAAKVIFSGLDASVAGEIEKAFAESGAHVISNTRNYRMDPTVPLLIPEVNPGHLELLKSQSFKQGKIITNPNCSTIGLSLALKPLHDQFEIESVHVVTFQAVSGAGYPGVASLDILDNVIPYIGDEERKMETETLKILGEQKNQTIEHAKIKISAQCNRVPVSEGHLECVSVKFKQKPKEEEIIHAWRSFQAEPQKLELPTAPKHPLYYFAENNFPQPKKHRDLDKGMAVSIGRLRPCPLFDYKFVILSHNTIRGAAGCAVLNAELLKQKNLI